MAKVPENKVIIVGGGLAGLLAAMKVCEGGGTVDLFSYCPVKRSHSLCAQGGMNACMDTKGEHDSVYEHFDDTVYGGDFLADQLAPGRCSADARRRRSATVRRYPRRISRARTLAIPSSSRFTRRRFPDRIRTV